MFNLKMNETGTHRTSRKGQVAYTENIQDHTELHWIIWHIMIVMQNLCPLTHSLSLTHTPPTMLCCTELSDLVML